MCHSYITFTCSTKDYTQQCFQLTMGPPTDMSNVLTTRPLPVCQKRISTSLTFSYMEQNSQSILSRNGSPLDCSHLALAYRYYFVWWRHENMSRCTGCRVNSSYKRIASRVGTKLRTWASGYEDTFRRTLLCPAPWPLGHDPSVKTVYHQLNGITHWTQQRVDSEQEWLFTGLLRHVTGIQILFYYIVWNIYVNCPTFVVYGEFKENILQKEWVKMIKCLHIMSWF